MPQLFLLEVQKRLSMVDYKSDTSRGRSESLVNERIIEKIRAMQVRFDGSE